MLYSVVAKTTCIVPTTSKPGTDTTDTVVVDTVKKDPMQSLFGVYDGVEHYTRYSITNYSDRTLILDTIVRSHVKVYRYGEGEVIAMVHTYLDPSSGDFVSTKYDIESSIQYFYILNMLSMAIAFVLLIIS